MSEAAADDLVFSLVYSKFHYDAIVQTYNKCVHCLLFVHSCTRLT